MSEYFRKKIEQVRDEADFLNEGGAQLVYFDPEVPEDSPDQRVIKLSHFPDEEVTEETIKQRKILFYATKIAKYLFPNNVPRIHAVTSDPPSSKSEFIEGVHVPRFDLEENNPNYRKDEEVRATLNRKERAVVRRTEALSESMKNSGFAIDDERLINFFETEDGNIVYIDDIGIRRVDGLANIEAAIDQKPDSDEKDRVLRYLERIKEILNT